MAIQLLLMWVVILKQLVVILKTDKMNKLIVVSADYCKPCKALKERLKEKGYEFEVIDAEENDDFCTKHKIRNVPTTMVMKEGTVHWRATGTLNEQQFEVMDKALNE